MGARLLVTGGAGYVGSHCVRRLEQAGHRVTVLDDLSHGHREAVRNELVVADLRDRTAVVEVLSRGFDAVLHFAARMSVPESVSDPVGYWDSNVGGTTNLLHAMASAGCRRIVFSSTCAVYGEPERVPIGEDTPFAPLSPYGETKAAVERALAAAREADVLDAISLRYFNAAGAASDGLLGEAHDPETHLIPIALDAAQQGRQMTLFGEDHPTRDGTCVRDYIHVEDLAEAHLIATERLLGGDRGGAWNLGSGDGASVKEVLDTVGVVTGKPVPYVIGPRRAGDAPALVSDTRRSREELGWQTRHGLRTILEHAWAWHRNPRFGVR